MSDSDPCQMSDLGDGRRIHCINPYEVAFGWHEICCDTLLEETLTFPPGVYFDVGANIGLFSIRLRDLCPTARIHAYEPMPSAFKALERNAAALGEGVQAIQMGLGREKGELTFDHFPALTALSTANSAVGETLSGGLRSLLSGAGSEQIRAIMAKTGAEGRENDQEFLDRLFRSERVTAQIATLAAEAQRLGVDQIELLKIDTEGGERAVLDGVGELWPRIRQLLVEVHGGAVERDSIAAELAARGYTVASDDHPLAEGGAPVFHLYARRV